MDNSIKPLISIVIPIYNREKMIKRLLEALRRQSYKKIEIICVDDGSTDRSAEIIEAYQQIDNRIVLYKKENGGAVSAVCEGICHMNGDYICFIDSDDLVGEDFIWNYVEQFDRQYDFIAFGFYYENGIQKKPYYLKENRVYSKGDLEVYKPQVLIECGSSEISNRFFISRWNKIYSRDCILKILPRYEKCIGVTLGEDTVFNHLLIQYATSGKTVRKANSYFYDVGDGDSVMRSNDCGNYLEKCRKAYYAFNEALTADGLDDRQALYVVYYHVSSIFSRMLQDDSNSFDILYAMLKKDALYIRAIKRFLRDTKSKKQKALLQLQLLASTGKIYRALLKTAKDGKNQIQIKRAIISFFNKNLKSYGIRETKQRWKYQRRRINAHKELEQELPVIEERLKPIIDRYVNLKTELSAAPIVKNVFVFWWDGFENAPQIVKDCFNRTKQVFSEAKVIEISKFNYKEYSQIHPELIKGFEENKISIQTFSDILRFNLLKTNGGVWVDATIFFIEKYNVFEMLKDKSYESLSFKDSADFLQYKSIKCSWSSYLQAARKGSVLIEVMNTIFEEYYLKYGDYGIYFFLDAALMSCKVNGVDDEVLDKINYCEGSAFELSKILDNEYDSVVAKDLSRIPQKLYWWYQQKNENTFYTRLVLEKGQKI